MKHEKKKLLLQRNNMIFKIIVQWIFSKMINVLELNPEQVRPLWFLVFYVRISLYICHHAIIISFCLCALGCFHFVEFVSSLLFVHFREQKSITNITTNKNPWKINANKKQKDKASKFEMENVLKRIEHKQNKTFKDFFIHIDWCVQCDICFAGSIIRLSKWKQHKD